MLRSMYPGTRYAELRHTFGQDSRRQRVGEGCTITISNCPPSPMGPERRCCTSLLSNGESAKSIMVSRKSNQHPQRAVQFAFSNLSQKNRYCCENSNVDSLYLCQLVLKDILLNDTNSHDIGTSKQPTSSGTSLIRNRFPLNFDLVGVQLQPIINHCFPITDKIEHIALRKRTQCELVLGV